MAIKIVDIPELGEVTLRKRRGSRNIRLKVDTSGKVTVSLPYLVPYKLATEYIKKHSDWVRAQQKKYISRLSDGMKVGRLHTLCFVYDQTAIRPKSRVSGDKIIIRHASASTDTQVQNAARRASLRALKHQSLQFLPKRLQDIAQSEGYIYGKVSVKQMRSRWGSCNQDKDIVLNIFLMELPIELIDYVILHELAHTRVLHHGSAFWGELEQHAPDAKLLRKKLREYQPTIPAKSVA